jgi:hypothetical protein
VPVDIPSRKGKESRHDADTMNAHGSWRHDEVGSYPHRAPGRDLPPPSDPARHYNLESGPTLWGKSSERGSHPVSNALPPLGSLSASRTTQNAYVSLPGQTFDSGRTFGHFVIQSASRSEPSNLTALGQKFVLIRVGQVREAVTFIIQNRTVLKENAQHYLREAGALYRRSRVQDARACVQQALIIDHCSDLSIDDTKEYLTDLAASRSSTVNKLLSNVDKTFAAVKAKSDKIEIADDNVTERASATVNNRHVNSERQHSLGSHRAVPSSSPTTSDLLNRFSTLNVTRTETSAASTTRPTPIEPVRPNRHQVQAGSRASQSSTGNHGSRNSLLPEEIKVRGTEGEYEPLDRRYRQVKNKAGYFVVGRVFAILWHENMGITNKKPGPDVKFTRDNRFGERIFSHIRRMIIVRQRYGYCWCVAINTYGGKGLIGKNWSHAEVQSHTVVYESTQKPAIFEEEQGLMTKQSIAVDMVSGHTLGMASRLNYAKVSTVEHNVKVMDIGMVSDTSMPYLITHWKDEMGY